MADDQEYGSKRERQKARRAERLEREAATAAKADTRQRLTYGLIVLLVIALIGGVIYSQIQSRQAASDQEAEVAERLGDLGCTEDVTMPDLGGTHIPAEQLQVQPPEIIYTGGAEIPGQPPSSGDHFASVAASGIYDVPIDPRLTTHNLEHGYVVIHTDPEASDETLAAVNEWADAAIGDNPKMIVSPYYEDLPGDNEVAFTAWFQRQMCGTFDTDVADVFVRNNYDQPEAPESGIPTHNPGAQGVLSPEEGDPGLFLPPLDVAFGSGNDADTEEAIEDAEQPEGSNEPEGGFDEEPAEDGAADEATESTDS